MSIPTLDQADVKGRTVLLRVDINSPLDPRTGDILEDSRMRESAPTIKELAEKGAKVVVLAHQGRPGDEDFTRLEKHARRMGEILGMPVRYVPDLLGPSAKEAIRGLKPGEILLLENVRFLAEESLSGPPEEMAKPFLVRELSSRADLYVNDAFGAAHRGQPSLVGFGAVLPTYAGRLMERELKGLGRGREPERPCVYVLGGGKSKDSMSMIENVLSKGIADWVLTGGLVSLLFLSASGVDLGGPNLQVLKEKGFEKERERAKRLLSTYGERIKLPVDVAVERKGRREEVEVSKLPVDAPVKDVGGRTISEYSELIRKAKTVVANGPLGVFEEENFEKGTVEVLRAMAGSGAYTIVGGGHMVAAAEKAGVLSKISHVSTGGGACISFLAGEPMPVVELLLKARR
ncbi:MAG: phosphoglycerate kinase [Candidatus Hadarchaeales archaeon]